MEKIVFNTYVISEKRLAGFLDYLRNETESNKVSIYSSLHSLKIGEIIFNRKILFRKNISKMEKNKKLVKEEDDIKTEINTFLWLNSVEKIKNIISDKVENKIREIRERLDMIPYIGIDTNIIYNGFIEEIIDRIEKNDLWRGVNIIVPKIVLQELFEHFSRRYSSRRYKEENIRLGIINFPKYNSRIARYGLSLILKGIKEGYCKVTGKIYRLEGGSKEYLSDLIIMEQIEEYCRMNLTPIIFLTGDFALSMISPFSQTIYIPKRIEEDINEFDIVDSIRFLKSLLICFGLVILTAEDVPYVLSYSWKGITLEDYYNSRISIAIPKEKDIEIKKYIYELKKLEEENVPWLRLIEKFLNYLPTL